MLSSSTTYRGRLTALLLSSLLPYFTILSSGNYSLPKCVEFLLKNTNFCRVQNCYWCQVGWPYKRLHGDFRVSQWLSCIFNSSWTLEVRLRFRSQAAMGLPRYLGTLRPLTHGHESCTCQIWSIGRPSTNHSLLLDLVCAELMTMSKKPEAP